MPPTPADIVQEGAQVPHTIITAHVTILSILDINDVDSFFKIFFSLELVWRDINVNYCFLKNETRKNIIPLKEEIWSPQISMMHLLNKRVDTINAATTIERLTEPKLYDDLDRIDACESFRGSENPIHREKTMVAEFICGFGEIMRNYPFGKETCSFKFFIRGSDNQLTNLTIGSLKNLAEVRKEFIE